MKNGLKRYGFFAGTFLITLLLYIDRICISTAKDAIGKELAITNTQMGWVLASFALGYALFQVPTGALGDRFGVRKVLSGIIAFWSIFTVTTGLSWNYYSLLIFRFIFGAGEAGAFPNISRAAFSWVPLKERGLFQGINFSGSRLGAAFALPIVANLIHLWGWRSIFYVFGIIGILVAIVFYKLFRNFPEDHPAISPKEKEYITSHRQQTNKTVFKTLSIKKILSNSNVLLTMGQYVSSNFIFFFMLTWLFSYIKEKYNLSLVSTGYYTMIPLLAGAAGNWVSGFLVDYIYKKNKWMLSRRLPAIIGFSLVIIGLLSSVHMATTASGAIVCLSIAVFGADMTLSPSWSFCMDIGQENSGKVSGMMNMAGNLGSFTTALAFPYLLKWTGSSDPFFYLASILAGLGIVMWTFMNPENTIDNED